MVILRLLLLFVCIVFAVAQDDEERVDIYLEQNSFREPFYLSRSSSLPYWDFGGSTIVADKFVRLTPKDQSRNGWMTNTHPLKVKNWAVRFKFFVGGGGYRGGDGFAIWYTKRPIEPGPVYGGSEIWDGLGLFFDTYDNDGQGDNPAIIAMLNHDEHVYNGDDDGSKNSLAKCVCPFRDRPINAELRYIDGMLELVTDVNGRASPKLCFSVSVNLPRGYFLSITAMTGQLVDQHDISSFQTFKVKKSNLDEEAIPDDPEPPKKKSRIPKIPQGGGEEEEDSDEPIKGKTEKERNLKAKEKAKRKGKAPAKKGKGKGKGKGKSGVIQVHEEDHIPEIHETRKLKRIPHVHGAKGDEGHFHKTLDKLADFEHRTTTDLEFDEEHDYSARPKTPTYTAGKTIDNIMFLQDVHNLLKWLMGVQNTSAMFLDSAAEVMKNDKDQLKSQHQIFSHHLSVVLKSLATKADVEDCLKVENENDRQSASNRLKIAGEEVTSLRKTIRDEQLKTKEDLAAFAGTVKSVRASLEVVSEDQKTLVTGLSAAVNQLSSTINNSSRFGLWGWIMFMQVTVAVVAAAYQIVLLTSRMSMRIPT